LLEEGVKIEDLYDKTKSMYKLVILASRRALELNAGAAKLLADDTDKVAQLALREIIDEKVTFKKSKTEKK
jgi:DNA-directed RNA polymerase omega subunit